MVFDLAAPQSCGAILLFLVLAQSLIVSVRCIIQKDIISGAETGGLLLFYLLLFL
jgi:hypothetical protein